MEEHIQVVRVATAPDQGRDGQLVRAPRAVSIMYSEAEANFKRVVDSMRNRIDQWEHGGD